MMLFVWCTVLAFVGFVGGLAVAGYALVRLPADFFTSDGSANADDHPVRRWTVRIVRNVVGAALVATGIVLLFVPGQGVLTMLFGLALIDFPGKRTVVRKLLGRPRILETANRWRARFGKPPLRAPEVRSMEY